MRSSKLLIVAFALLASCQSWNITSTPPGARVIADGAAVGKTPCQAPSDAKLIEVKFHEPSLALQEATVKIEGRVTSETTVVLDKDGKATTTMDMRGKERKPVD